MVDVIGFGFGRCWEEEVEAEKAKSEAEAEAQVEAEIEIESQMDVGLDSAGKELLHKGWSYSAITDLYKSGQPDQMKIRDESDE